MCNVRVHVSAKIVKNWNKKIIKQHTIDIRYNINCNHVVCHENRTVYLRMWVFCGITTNLHLISSTSLTGSFALLLVCCILMWTATHENISLAFLCSYKYARNTLLWNNKQLVNCLKNFVCTCVHVCTCRSSIFETG